MSRKKAKHHPRLWEHQRGLCFYCDVPMIRTQPSEQKSKSGRLATLDHRVPRAKGGHRIRSNLVLACASCNQKKADKSETDFLMACRGWLVRKRQNDKNSGFRVGVPSYQPSRLMNPPPVAQTG